MIQRYTFKAPKTGPRVLFFGAIHGNEVCGPKAIARVVQEIRSGKIQLLQGSATFVPLCNPRAHARGKRYTEQNLNRLFRKTKRPRSYEARLANALTKLVDRADVLLDLHSITAEGEAFIYIDYPTKKTRAFAKILGPKKAVVGWPALYKKLGSKHPSFDTTTYAAKLGIDGLLLECGPHKSKKSVDVAYRAILNTLKHYGLVAGKPRAQHLKEARMTRAFFRSDKADRFAKSWKHMDKIRKGETVIREARGGVLRSPFDGFVIMPNKNAPVGDDWLYLGRKV